MTTLVTNTSPQIIQQTLLALLETAQKSIWVAVAWFTDQTLAEVLWRKAKQGVAVRLVAVADELNEEQGIDFQGLSEQGAEVLLWEGNELMHHKFCVVDKLWAVVGSYNYTYAAQNQWESVVVIKNKQQATELHAEFDRIVAAYWQQVAKEEGKSPLTLAWWHNLLHYGKLNKKGLKNYTWQHIFRLHLALHNKGIALTNETVYTNGANHQSSNCFEVYQQLMGKKFAVALTPLTKPKLHQLTQIKSLWLTGLGIKTLAPLQPFAHLEELYCGHNQLPDLAPLATCQHLHTLHAWGNELTNIESLNSLPNLQEWNLEGNPQVGSVKGKGRFGGR